MEISCCSSLMASYYRPTNPYSSLASRSSLFFTNGSSTALPKTRLSFASRRRRVAGGGGADGSPASRGLAVKCLFGLGVPELAVIAGVAALVFGPKQLPEIGRSIGKTVKSFQQAAKEFETELKKEPGDTINPPPESPQAVVGNEGENKELEATVTKESS